MKVENTYHYSLYTDEGLNIAESVIRTLGNLIRKSIFLAGKASWINELPSINTQTNNTAHHSNKMTPIQTSIRKNEKLVYNNLNDNRISGNRN